MISHDKLAISEVGNGSSQFEDVMIGTSGEVELLHSGLHELLCGWLNLAKCAYLDWPISA